MGRYADFDMTEASEGVCKLAQVLQWQHAVKLEMRHCTRETCQYIRCDQVSVVGRWYEGEPSFFRSWTLTCLIHVAGGFDQYLPVERCKLKMQGHDAARMIASPPYIDVGCNLDRPVPIPKRDCPFLWKESLDISRLRGPVEAVVESPPAQCDNGMGSTVLNCRRITECNLRTGGGGDGAKSGIMLELFGEGYGATVVAQLPDMPHCSVI